MTVFKTYEEAEDYLRSFTDVEKMVKGPAYPADFTLDRMNDLLELVDWPNRDLEAVHIAGTKGKSSTAFMVEALLRATGLTTGVFTSPHLVHREERIRVNGEMITQAELLDLMNELGPHLIALRDQGKAPTFFDIITTAAFLAFRHCGIDASVFEVGLGGRLDSTNVLTPRVSAVTALGIDHTDKLGDDLESIAAEKAGIIKPGVPVISHPQEPAAMKVIEDRCIAVGARLLTIGAEITVGGAAWPEQPFEVRTERFLYDGLSLRALGAHQRVNAASAITLAEMFLHRAGRRLDPSLARKVLGEIELPGRTNLLDGEPKVLLDGAHNVMAIRGLMDTIDKSVPRDRLIALFACSRDKDIEGMLRIMAPLVDEWVLSGIDFPRTAAPSEVAEKLKNVTDTRPILCDLPEEAWERALGLAGPGDLICCCGSFYLAGEVQQLMARKR